MAFGVEAPHHFPARPGLSPLGGLFSAHRSREDDVRRETVLFEMAVEPECERRAHQNAHRDSRSPGTAVDRYQKQSLSFDLEGFPPSLVAIQGCRASIALFGLDLVCDPKKYRP